MKKNFALLISIIIIFSYFSISSVYADDIGKYVTEDTENQIPIVSGSLYDEIHALCPKALLYGLYEDDNTLTIDVTDMDTSGGVNPFSHRFMSLSVFILAQCNISSEFKNINFVYAANDNVVSLQISKFKNIGNFTSNLWCIADDKTTEWMNTYYDNTYGRHDLHYQLNSQTNEIIKKYGGTTSDIDAQNNDTLWREASFQNLKAYKTEGDTLSLTVYGFELSQEGGHTFNQSVEKAKQNFCDIFDTDNSSLSFRNFTINCIDYPSGKEIVSVAFTLDDSYTIHGKYSTCTDSAFAKGILQ